MDQPGKICRGHGPPRRPRAGVRVAWVAAVGLVISGALAHAQRPGEVDPAARNPPPHPSDFREFLAHPHLTDNPDNYRSDLAARGLTFSLLYTNEYYGVARGDTLRGHDSDFGRVRLTVNVDFGKLAGLDGLTFLASGVNQNGSNAAASIGSFTNPNIYYSSQTTRLDTCWLQQSLFGGVLVLRAGQLAQQDDYGVQEYTASFLLEPLGYAYGNLFTAVTATFDPASKPGVEVRLYPYRGLYLKSEFQGGDPDPDGNHDHHGLNFSLDGHGVLATEVGYRQQDITQPNPGSADGGKGGVHRRAGPRWFWEGRLPAVYKLGLYNNFADFVDFRNGYRVHGNYLVYGSINQAIFRESHEGPGRLRGLDAFVGADYAPGNVTLAPVQVIGGARYQGLIPGRDKDTLAVGAVYTRFSSRANTPASLALNGRYTEETALELNYVAQVTGWLLVQPLCQFYFNPGGTGRHADAVLLGFHSKVVF